MKYMEKVLFNYIIRGTEISNLIFDSHYKPIYPYDKFIKIYNARLPYWNQEVIDDDKDSPSYGEFILWDDCSNHHIITQSLNDSIWGGIDCKYFDNLIYDIINTWENNPMLEFENDDGIYYKSFHEFLNDNY